MRGVDVDAEQEFADRLVQLRGGLDVLRDDVRVAQRPAEQARVVDRGAAGERERDVGDLGRRRSPRGRRPNGCRCAASSDTVVAAPTVVPGCRPTRSSRKARAARRRASGTGHLDLREAALGQRARRVLRPLALREVDHLVERAAGDAEADRRDARGEEPEVREPRQRRVDDRARDARVGSCARPARTRASTE